jgi:hypothetical protein
MGKYLKRKGLGFDRFAQIEQRVLIIEELKIATLRECARFCCGPAEKPGRGFIKC